MFQHRHVSSGRTFGGGEVAMARRLVSLLLLLPTLSHRLLARRFRSEERILGRGPTGGRGRRARGLGGRGGGIRFLTLSRVSAQTLGNFAFRPGAALLAPWKYRRCLECRHRGHIFRTVANSIRIEASISSIDHRCRFHRFPIRGPRVVRDRRTAAPSI